MKWQVAIRAQLASFDLDVALQGDERALVVGPNGSGKTTLLRMMVGAQRPDEGSIQIGGVTVFDEARGIDVLPEHRAVGYVPQGFGLFPHASVLDNVAFGLRYAHRVRGGSKMPRAQREQVATEMLEQLDSVHLSHRKPERLSGGEQQRVALARALMTRPRLLLMDEPLSAMDAAARRRFRTYLSQELRRQAVPALWVTHDPRDVWAFDGPVFVLEAGRIVQTGSARTLFEDPRTDFVAEFFGLPAPADS
ncbi:MAG: ABC transporter ATP-binding protein [Myxococcota bacterium]